MRIFTLFFTPFIIFFLLPGNLVAQDLAAWVVRFDIDSREKIDIICSQAQKSNFDRLLVQVRGRADAYYKSELIPRAEDLEDDFDPLGEILAQCTGVEIDAWLNVYYLWTGDKRPIDDSHPALQASWLIKDRLGRSVDTYTPLEQSQRWIEGVYADPASESYRRYFADAVVELVKKYPVGGIHLDFVRYPGAYFGNGGSLAREFEHQYGVAVKELPERITRQDFAAWLNGSLPTKDRQLITARLIWDYRRAAEVTKLVALVRSELQRVRQGVRLSASVFPDPLESFLDKGQDWPTWLQEGVVDELFMMNYFGDQHRVHALHNEVVQLVGNDAKIWLGLAAYIKSVTDIAGEIALCKGGKQGTCFFSLGHLLRQQKSIQAYADIVHEQLEIGEVFQGEARRGHLTSALQSLKKCLAEFGNPACEEGSEWHLHKSMQQHLNASHKSKGAWLQLRGIFRYINPYDNFERVEKQLDLALESHQFLLDGVPFAEVAEDYSQAGSRYHGGLLPRRYLRKGNRVDEILAELEPGQVSPVIPAHNGFWVYQVIDKGKM